MNDENKWVCPICMSRAYQNWGAKMERVTKLDGETSYRKMGGNFMCKGCSVFFNNPRIFNKRAVEETKTNNE